MSNSVTATGQARQPRILLVEDDLALQKALTRVLNKAGFETLAMSDPVEALAALEVERELDAALLDIALPHLSGLDVLAEIKRRRPDVEVVIMTGHATAETALQAVKAGAHDYLIKPFQDVEHVAVVLRKACERKGLLARNLHLERMLEAKVAPEEMVGQSGKMLAVFKLVQAVGPSSATVLIRGESGTGKELVARAVHRSSARRDKPFIAVNASALSETLLDSELFGHVKGAFTGAVGSGKGLFEEADGGTLFLDEIGDVPPATQVRLLRALQEGEIRPVGASKVVKVDVRVIAATNADLRAKIQDGSFREDLYYRLSVITLELPPLRDRPDDLPLLAHHLLKKHAAKMGKEVQGFSQDFLETLYEHTWPGNVRELENVIQRAVVLATGPLVTAEVLPSLGNAPRAAELEAGSLADLPYAQAKKLAVGGFERRYLAALLRRANGVISEAARAAGLDRSNFRRLLKAHSLAGARGEDGQEGDELDAASPATEPGRPNQAVPEV